LDDATRVTGAKLERAHIGQRQRAWKRAMEQAASGSSRREVCERAWLQHGNILGRILEGAAASRAKAR